MGVSGREMMRALIAGQRDPEVLAQLARGRMRTKIPQLRKALTARFRTHHAYLLDRMLTHAEALDTEIADLDTRIDAAGALLPTRLSCCAPSTASTPAPRRTSSPRSAPR